MLLVACKILCLFVPFVMQIPNSVQSSNSPQVLFIHTYHFVHPLIFEDTVIFFPLFLTLLLSIPLCLIPLHLPGIPRPHLAQAPSRFRPPSLSFLILVPLWAAYEWSSWPPRPKTTKTALAAMAAAECIQVSLVYRVIDLLRLFPCSFEVEGARCRNYFGSIIDWLVNLI